MNTLPEGCSRFLASSTLICLAMGCVAPLQVGGTLAQADDPLSEVREGGASGSLGNDFPELKISCVIKGGGRRYITDGSDCIVDSNGQPGDYEVTLRSACQPDTIIHISNAGRHPQITPPSAGTTVAGVVKLFLPTPAVERRYVPDGVSLWPLSRRSLRGSPDGQLRPPPNTSVDLLRVWPDASGKCSHAVVRIVDAGKPDERGKTFVTLVDMLSKEPVSDVSPAQWLGERRAEKQREFEERQAAHTAKLEEARRKTREAARTISRDAYFAFIASRECLQLEPADAFCSATFTEAKAKLQDAIPHHIAKAAIYKEGGGFRYYITLVNERGEQIAAPGTLVLRGVLKSWRGTGWNVEDLVSQQVTKADYTVTQLGVGGIGGKALVVSGWISMDDMYSRVTRFPPGAASNFLQNSKEYSNIDILFLFDSSLLDSPLKAREDLPIE